MPKSSDRYAHLDELSTVQLTDLQEKMSADFPEDFEEVEDDILMELFEITRRLIAKSKTPKRKKAPATPKTVADLADLFK